MKFVETYPNPCKPKSKLDNALHAIWAWKAIASFADKRVKKLWEQWQGPEGVVPVDDVIRQTFTEGETIHKETPNYSLIVALSAPRETFSLEKFILAVSKQYKIDVVELTTISQDCKVFGTRSVTKKILDA